MSNSYWKIIHSPCNKYGEELWPTGGRMGLTSLACTLYRGYFDDGIKIKNKRMGTFEITTKLVDGKPLQLMQKCDSGRYFRVAENGRTLISVKMSEVKELEL